MPQARITACAMQQARITACTMQQARITTCMSSTYHEEPSRLRLPFYVYTTHFV